MKRKIIQIDRDACIGCGLCVSACHEGAIGMVDGKATLLRDDYCDGLGNCLPVCPVDAIHMEEREAAPYDEAAVQAKAEMPPLACGCPGSAAKTLARPSMSTPAAPAESCLRQWPVQIKLAPPNAPYFSGADLLIAADCTAFAFGGFHQVFMKDKITLIGCPKLDEGDYTEKLAEILRLNTIQSLCVARMEVPCCGGIERAARQALASSGKDIPLQVVTLSTDGRVLE